MPNIKSLRLLYIVGFIALLAPIKSFSQAKVGTSGAQFLEMSFSARSSSLGKCGLTLIDENAALTNPGALGLFYSDRRATLSMMIPLHLNGGYSLRAGSIGYGFDLREAKPDRSRLILAIAYNRISLNSSWWITRTYQNVPIGDTLHFYASDKADYLSAAIAWEGRVRVGLGLSLLKIEERYQTVSTKGVALNLGFLIEAPFKLGQSEAKTDHYRFTPTIGLALLNFGKDLKMYSDYYPLPRKFNIGVSLKLDRIVNNLSTLSARLLVEKHYDVTPINSDHIFRIGAEFGFYDALYLRLGHYHSYERNKYTYGIGTKLSGLINTFARWNLLPSRSALARFSETIDISYNYGNLNYDMFGPNGYHQFSISLK